MDTATADQDPQWLREAEADYLRDLTDDLPRGLEAARRVREVNARLAELQITPLSPAYVDEAGYFRGAPLCTWDQERELWGVDAVHNGQDVVLEVENWDVDEFRPGPVLRCRADVARARHQGAPDPADAASLSASLHQALDLVEELATLLPRT